MNLAVPRSCAFCNWKGEIGAKAHAMFIHPDEEWTVVEQMGREFVVSTKVIGDEPKLLEPRETFDPCLVGIARQFNRRFAVYDEAKVLEAFAEMFADDDDDPDLAAREWFEFNVVGAWLGEGTPAFTAPMEDEEDE